MKDYFICSIILNGQEKLMWCSSLSWIFSELPKVINDQNQLVKLNNINNLFTGVFDMVLFENNYLPVCIDAELGIYM